MNHLIGFEFANWLDIELYLLVAHLVIGLLAYLLLIYRQEKNAQSLPLMKRVILAVSYILLVFWSLSGFYDGISIFFLLISLLYYREQKPIPALLYFSLGLLLHFRALWFLPMLGLIIIDLYRRRALLIKPSNIMITTLSICLVTISLYVLFIEYSNFYNPRYMVNHPLFYPILMQPAGIVALLFIAIIILKFLRSKLYLLASIVFWQTCMLTQMPSMHLWYNLFLLVIFAIAATSPPERQYPALLWSTIFFVFETILFTPFLMSFLL